MNLLIDQIKKMLNEEKNSEIFQLDKVRKEDLKRSYEFFKKQLELIEKGKKNSKIKKLFSELHALNNDEKDNSKEDSLQLKIKNNFKFFLKKLKNKNKNKKEIKEEENKIDKEEKKKLLIEEINLINEIKDYMNTIDDPENQQKFENLLGQIDLLKKMNNKEYINKIREKFGNVKNEITDLYRVKEIEERINGFVDDLDKEIDKCEIKRNFYGSLINVVDHKFKSTIENPKI